MATITSTELGASGRYINLGTPSALANLGDYTMLAYARPASTQEAGLGYVFSKSPSTGAGPRLFLGSAGGSLYDLTGGTSSTGTTLQPYRKSSSNVWTASTWCHFAITFDGSLNGTGYHNYVGAGVDLAETSYGTTLNGTTALVDDSTYNANIMNREGLGRAFVGDLAYYAIWDRVLTLTEMQDAQNNGPLSVPTGLVLLWANQSDLGPNAITPASRSTYVAGAIPPNTALGGSADTALTVADAAHAHTVDNVTLSVTGDSPLTVSDATHAHAADNVVLTTTGDTALTVSDATHAHTADNIALSTITILADFERSSVNVAASSVSGVGDSAIVTIRPRVQESEVDSSQFRWLSPLAKVVGVNGTRPTFRFDQYVDTDGGYHWFPWDSGRKPMFSYDLQTWEVFDTTSINTGYIEFRDNQTFTSDTVYVSRGRVRTVAQTGAWISALAAVFPSYIHNVPSNTSGYSSGTFAAQTNELGETIPAQPFYAFKISDSSLSPDAGVKGNIVLVSGVHAGEDQTAWALESLISFVLGGDVKAQNIRANFDIYVYPMLNAPGRAGGGWRGSFTQGTGGIDDANRHFSDASPGLEIVTLPRSAMLTDLSGLDIHVMIDMHGHPHTKYSMYFESGNTKQTAFDAALEVYLGSGAVANAGGWNAGYVAEWFNGTLNADFYIITELGDPTPLTDSDIQAWGESHAKAISDLLDSGDIYVEPLLAPADASHAQTVDSITLEAGGDTSLTVQDAVHDHAADFVVLTSNQSVVPADSAHAQSADNVVLDVGSALLVSDSAHAQTADNVVLVAATSLVVADAAHAQSADNVMLQIVGQTNLVVADASHAQTADSVVITQDQSIAVSDATHAQTSESVVITVTEQLSVDSAAHAHSADNLVITYTDTSSVHLVVSDAVHVQQTESPVLFVEAQLALTDSILSITVDGIILSIPEVFGGFTANNYASDFDHASRVSSRTPSTSTRRRPS